MRQSALAFAVAAPLLLAACGGSEPRPALGAPITAPMNQWTWVDVPESTCNDGTPTGIGVNLNGSPNVVMFLNGGGACWDYSTCEVLHFASSGPFGKAQFESAMGEVGTAGSIFDRTVAANPFKDWNMVFVPYCTGDLHGGDRDVMYQGGGNPPVAYHHRGHSNFLAFVARVAGTIPSPTKAVLTGASAGGYGTMLNYDTFRRYFPTGEVYGLDDSGPPLIGDEVPPSFRASFYAQWGLADTLGTICPGCVDDLSLLAPALAKKYPHDRLALLESMQDKTIRGYLLKSASGMDQDLRDLASMVLDPLAPNVRYFYIPGETHTMEGDPGQYTASDGTNLWPWITQMVSDDSTWTSHLPSPM